MFGPSCQHCPARLPQRCSRVSMLQRKRPAFAAGNCTLSRRSAVFSLSTCATAAQFCLHVELGELRQSRKCAWDSAVARQVERAQRLHPLHSAWRIMHGLRLSAACSGPVRASRRVRAQLYSCSAAVRQSTMARRDTDCTGKLRAVATCTRTHPRQLCLLAIATHSAATEPKYCKALPRAPLDTAPCRDVYGANSSLTFCALTESQHKPAQAFCRTCATRLDKWKA
jgi:hypothetical protein